MIIHGSQWEDKLSLQVSKPRVLLAWRESSFVDGWGRGAGGLFGGKTWATGIRWFLKWRMLTATWIAYTKAFCLTIQAVICGSPLIYHGRRAMCKMARREVILIATGWNTGLDSFVLFESRFDLPGSPWTASSSSGLSSHPRMLREKPTQQNQTIRGVDVPIPTNKTALRTGLLPWPGLYP